MTIDTEHNLYKVYFNSQEHYCVWASIADVMAGYEDASEVTKVEYVDICYISPFIFNSLK